MRLIAAGCLALALTATGASAQFLAAYVGTTSGAVEEEVGGSDFATRCADPGVLWCEAFDAEADVDNWRFTNVNGAGWDADASEAGSDLMSWESSGGHLSGGGFLRIEDGATGESPLAWWRNFDPQYTSGNHTATLIVDPGDTVYFAFSMRVSAERNANSPSDGIKMAEITTSEDTNVGQEVFVYRLYIDSGPQLKGSTLNDGCNLWEYVPQPEPCGGDETEFDLQPGSEIGECLYSTQPTGCYVFEDDVWEHYLLTVNGGTEEGNNTVASLSVAVDGEWQAIFSRTDLHMPLYENHDGYSAIALFSRAENHTDNGVDNEHDFDDLIVSTSPIDPPGGFAKPSWFTSVLTATNTWYDANDEGIVSNITSDVVYTTGEYDAITNSPGSVADINGITAAWVGGTFDTDRGEIVLQAGGGHNAYPGNEGYAIKILDEAPVWRRFAEAVYPSPATLTGAEDTKAGYGDGSFDGTSPSTTHSYNRICYGNNRVWLPSIDSQETSSGESSTATYAYERTGDDTGAWEYYGIGMPNYEATYGVNGRILGGACAYDPVTQVVYSFHQQAQSTTPLFFGVDATNNSQSSPFIAGFAFTADNYKWAVVAEDLRLLIWGSEQGGSADGREIVTGDLDDLSAFTSRTTSGYVDLTLGTGVVYHEAARKLYFYNHSFDGDVVVVDIPDPISGTWAFSTASITGTPAFAHADDDDGESAGPFGRFGGHEFDDGSMLLWVVPHVDLPMWLMRVDAAGL